MCAYQDRAAPDASEAAYRSNTSCRDRRLDGNVGLTRKRWASPFAGRVAYNSTTPINPNPQWGARFLTAGWAAAAADDDYAAVSLKCPRVGSNRVRPHTDDVVHAVSILDSWTCDPLRRSWLGVLGGEWRSCRRRRRDGVRATLGLELVGGEGSAFVLKGLDSLACPCFSSYMANPHCVTGVSGFIS